MQRNNRQSGFSLVELSIVLVILGLLVGGILAGQSLIRAGELRSVSADISKYSTAIYAFRDKYIALPGDMTNATTFWGKDTTSSASCAIQTGTSANPGTCNGDGNGAIGSFSSPTEGYRAWQHLALAGLVEGNYPGTQSGWGSSVVIGTDVPASKLNNAAFTILNFSQQSSVNYEVGFPDLPDTRYNMLLLGGKQGSTLPEQPAITPTDAWNIDTKMDDGRPAFGKVRGGTGSGVGCVDVTTSSTASYYLSNAAIICRMGFLL